MPQAQPSPTLTREPSPSQRLLALFESHRLSPAQRLIAQFILANLRDVVFMSGAELAEHVGVSQPSVTRFAMAVGFDGYPNFLRYLRELVSEARGSVDQSPVNKYQDAIHAEIGNLHRLASSLADAVELERAGHRLAMADPLVALGLRVSAPVATYFAYFAEKIHPDVRLLTEGGSRLYDLLLRAACGSAVLVAFLMPRYPREAIRALDYAKRQGMSIVLVSDTPLAPGSEHADALFAAQLGTRTVFDSQAAPLVLANLLVEAMRDANAERTEERLEAFEHMAAEQQVFWTP